HCAARRSPLPPCQRDAKFRATSAAKDATLPLLRGTPSCRVRPWKNILLRPLYFCARQAPATREFPFHCELKWLSHPPTSHVGWPPAIHPSRKFREPTRDANRVSSFRQYPDLELRPEFRAPHG